jgi:hypothetical protein
MSIDLSFAASASQSPAGAPIGKANSLAKDGQEISSSDDAPFEALLSELIGDNSPQVERPLILQQGSRAPLQGDTRPDSRSRADNPPSNPTESGNPSSFASIDWSRFCACPIGQHPSTSGRADSASSSVSPQAAVADRGSSTDYYDAGNLPSILTPPSLEEVSAAISTRNSVSTSKPKGKIVPDNDEAAERIGAPPTANSEQSVLFLTGQPLAQFASAGEKRDSLSRDSGNEGLGYSAKSAGADQLAVTTEAASLLKIPATTPDPGRAKSAKGGTEGTHDPGTPETMKHVTIQSFATHFPAVLSGLVANALPKLSEAATPSPEQANVNVNIAPTPSINGPRQQSAAPIKVLTIELEPATLGSVVVKMKMSRANVDIHISVDSQGALSALKSSREKLVDAIKSTGCSVSSYTIQTDVSSASANYSQDSAFPGSQSLINSSDTGDRGNIGREGASHGDRSNGQHQNSHSSKGRERRDSASSRDADRSHGLYL